MDFGIKCVAMQIFDRNRNLYAAISISGLASHFTEEKLSLQMRWQFFVV
ncbi:IclR family transcriptional regulator domain-containing protein [Blautia obeum]